MKFQFPAYKEEWAKTNHRYYGLQSHQAFRGYFTFVKFLLEAGGLEVELVDAQRQLVKGHPQVSIEGKSFAVDIGENFKNYWDKRLHFTGLSGLFQLHWDEQQCVSWRGDFPGFLIEPIGPTSFYNWRLFEELLLRPEPPIDKRTKVIWKQIKWSKRENLGQWRNVSAVAASDPRIDKKKLVHEEFLEDMRTCLAMIHIPGTRDDILDKATMQAFGLGTCVIGPKLAGDLAFREQFRGGEHFVECRPDFSDVREKLAWVTENQKEAREIGERAKAHFREYCHPTRIVDWILECLEIERS